MFSLRYIASEFRRRRGRAILTAIGLGMGVALVILVGALSRGLDGAQDEVLEPLTGVGTEISVSRPLRFEDGEPLQLGRNGNLTEEEQALLQAENGGGGRIAFDTLGEPGEPFDIDRFQAFELSFPQEDSATIAAIDGVEAVAGQLTLNLTRIEGEVPEAGAFGGGPGRGGGGPGGFDISTAQISGVDLSQPDIAAVTPEDVVEGGYFAAEVPEVILSEGYAGREGISVGETLSIASKDYAVIGLAAGPVGGESSDIYVELGLLQEASEREGRINRLRVRATEASEVDAVAASVEQGVPGTRATTASDLADRVEGSLADARSLADTLGTALAVISLVAAVGLATLLTLNSVAKRTRELGTLRAIGWSRSRVVRQVGAESVVLGLLGATVGVVLGIVGAQIMKTLLPTLEASVRAGTPVVVGPGGGAGGQLAAEPSQQAVAIGAPIDMDLVLLGVALAIAGGAIAGLVAGLRAARLQPSEALRSVE